MPEVLEMEPQQQETTPSAELPRRGRPPKSNADLPDFWSRLKGLNWDSNRYMGYLYRLEPRRRLDENTPKYITKFGNGPMDQDQIMLTYGSGKYQINVTEANGKSRHTENIDNLVFDIENMTYPPQVPLGQWLDDPQNDRWKWAKPMLEKQAAAAAAPAPAPIVSGIGADPAKLVQTVAEAVKQSQPNATEAVNTAIRSYEEGRRQGAEGAKGTPLSEVAALITALKPAQASGEDPILKLMLAQMQADRERAAADREAAKEQARADRERAERELTAQREQAKIDREAAEKRADAAEKRHEALMTTILAKKDVDPLDSLKSVASLITAFREISDGGFGGGGDDSWTGLLKEGIREALPQIAPGLGTALGGALRFAGGPRPVVPNQNPTQAATIAPAPQDAQPGATQQAAAPSEQDPYIPAYRFLLENFRPMLNYLNHEERTGFDFADWLVEGNGRMGVEQVKAAGRDRVIAALKTVPDAWNHLAASEPQLVQFLDEFIAWPEPPADEEEDSPAEAPVGTRKARKKSGKVVQ